MSSPLPSTSSLELSPPINAAIAPLLAALPLERALTALVVPDGFVSPHRALVEQALGQPALLGLDALAAGLWLYVDELDRSHKISQRHEGDKTFDFWHGIMHRREGDFSNSHYWFRRVGTHDAFASIAAPSGESYDPHIFIDRAEAAHAKPEGAADLIDLQRREWATLFAWCARKA